MRIVLGCGTREHTDSGRRDASGRPVGGLPYERRLVVGAVGRGRFVAYETVDDLDAAAALVVRLLTEPVRSVPEEKYIPEYLEVVK